MNERTITNTDNWIKQWSRGMKIQRGIFYAIAIGKPFEKIFGTSLDSWLYVSRGEAVDFYAKEDQLQTFSIYMKRKLMEDESFSHLIVSNYEQLYQPHLRFLNQLDKMDLAKLSNDELILLLDQYRKSLCPYGSAIWLVVTIEKEMEEVAYETFKNMKVNDIEKWTSTLFSLTQPNYILEEELALLQISQLSAQKQEAALHEHAKKFEYIPLYDYDYEPYSLAYFKKRLDELNTDPNAKNHIAEKEKNVKQNAKKLEQLLSTPIINEKEKLRLRMLNALFNHKDQRSHYRSIDSYMGKKIYDELASRVKLSLSNLLFLTDEEITEKLNNPNKQIDLEPRRKGYALIVEHGRVELLTGKSMQDYLKKNLFEEMKNQITGLSVTPGFVKGVARVILHPSEISKIQQNDILVTPMTRPDYVSFMKKCAAIVTDEGGMLCHAAIVSRELNIPCVVGTKTATSIIKDGDMIEVDANKGVVKIISTKPEKKNMPKLNKPKTAPIAKGKNPLLINGIKWIHVVTRNQSFWHQIQSTMGHFFSSKNFGINVKLRLGNLEVHGTESNVFIEEQNLNEYTEKTVELMQSRTSMEQLRRNYELYTIELENSLNECLKEFTLTNWNRFGKQYAKYGAGLFVTNMIGKEGVVQLQKRLKELGYNEKEIPKIISIITYPEKNTPLFQSQMDLMEIAKNIQQRSPSKSQLPSMLQEWWNKHGYIPVNFNEDPWTMEEVQTQLDAMLQKNCEKEIEEFVHGHLKRVQNAKEKINSINDFVISNYAYAIQEGTSLNEFRKNIFSRVSLHMRPLFEQLAKKAGMNHWRECYYFMHEELGQLLQGKKLEIQKIIKEREHVFFYIDMEGRTIFATPKQTQAIFHYVQALHGQGAKRESTITQIKGFSANAGKVRGIARILLSAKDFHKFNPKEILVTTMTSVDFVPIMEKAAAFVTNDGGITSHAAIVAREMGKPCIIGTKNATQVIKDGDLIEVDGDNGVVRILK